MAKNYLPLRCLYLNSFNKSKHIHRIGKILFLMKESHHDGIYATSNDLLA